VDSALYGKRVKILVGSAALVVGTQWVQDLAWLQLGALVLFTVLFATLALARIAMFRDEDGRWSPALGLRSLRDDAVEIAEGVQRFRDAKPTQRMQMAGSTLVATGLLLLATRAVWDGLYRSGLDSWEFDWPREWDAGLFVVGVLLWLRGLLATHAEGKRTSLLVDPDKEPARARDVAAAFGALPAIVDCRDASVVAAVAEHAGHPLVRSLMGALVEWNPRRAEDEKAYQRSLFRHLGRVLPEAEALREAPLRSQGVKYFGRIDILLGRCVLIEMKRRLTTSTTQKAIGQIEMYGHLWQAKGPVVLLVCDTDPAYLPLVEAAIERMRTAGHSAVAVLAGP
jgi:hypothetical protein